MYSVPFLSLPPFLHSFPPALQTSATFSLSPSNLNQSAVEVFTSLMQSTSHNISQLTSYIDHTFLPDVVSTATYLRDNQASIASAQLLEEFQDIDEDLHCFVPKKSREQCKDTTYCAYLTA